MLSSGRLWGRQANVDSPGSGSGPTITTGWHTLVRVWDGQQVRQYVDGLRTNTTVVTATGSWSIYKWGWDLNPIEQQREVAEVLQNTPKPLTFAVAKRHVHMRKAGPKTWPPRTDRRRRQVPREWLKERFMSSGLPPLSHVRSSGGKPLLPHVHQLDPTVHGLIPELGQTLQQEKA